MDARNLTAIPHSDAGSLEAAGAALCWAQPDNSTESSNSSARINASPFLFLRMYRLHLFPCMVCGLVCL